MNVTRLEDRFTDTQIFVEYNEETSFMRISIPGTKTWKDVITDLMFWQKDGIHWGVHRSVVFILDELMNWYMAIGTPDVEEILIRGSSLGGGLAQGLALKMSEMGFGEITVEAYGTIKIFGRRKVKSVNHVFKFTAFVYGSDPIPLLVPWLKLPEGKVTYIGPPRSVWKALWPPNWKHHNMYGIDFRLWEPSELVEESTISLS